MLNAKFLQSEYSSVKTLSGVKVLMSQSISHCWKYSHVQPTIDLYHMDENLFLKGEFYFYTLTFDYFCNYQGFNRVLLGLTIEVLSNLSCVPISYYTLVKFVFVLPFNFISCSWQGRFSLLYIIVARIKSFCNVGTNNTYYVSSSILKLFINN